MERTSSSLLFDILKVAFIFLVAVTMVSIVVFFLLRTVIRGKEVEVPNVIGKGFIEASEILQESGLRTPRIEGRKYSANLDKDHVVEQRPIPKEKVKINREVKVFLSLGTESEVVPRVIGQSISEAESLLALKGLEIGSIIKVHSDSFPREGAIIAHTPPANTEINRGSKVNLLVSLGPHSMQVTIPDLSSMKLQDARKLLESSGLKEGRITYEASAHEMPNTVLKQIPPPEERVERGTLVDLVISSSIKTSATERRLVRLSYRVPKRPRSSEDSVQEDLSKRYVKILIEDDEQIWTQVDDMFDPGDLLIYPFQISGKGRAKIYVDDMKWPIETMICVEQSSKFVSQ